MKEYAVAMLVFLGGSGIIAQAKPLRQNILLTNVMTIDLQIKESEIGLSVLYPGPSISGICGIEIRADSPIENFLNVIEIKSFDPRIQAKLVNSTTIDIDMSTQDMSYVADVSIVTKDGSSLGNAIKKTLGENRTVIALATTCK